MVGAILQCRMSSRRLPGKVLLTFPWGHSTTLIGRIHNQIKLSKRIKNFILATSTDSTDDPIEELCRKLSINYFRGSLSDVHQRFLDANQAQGFEHCVRLTGDNPLVDVSLLDSFIDQHLISKNDYSYTTHLPLGCNFEIYRASALRSFIKKEMSEEECEHVTLRFKRQPQNYQIGIIQTQVKQETLNRLSEMRLTIDYPSDYAFWNLLTQMNPSINKLEDLLPVIEKFPWIQEINNQNTQLVFN